MNTFSDNNIEKLDLLIKDFIEEEPTENEIIDYLDGNCDETVLARLEAHFLINSASRRQMGILQQSALEPVLGKLREKNEINALLDNVRSESVDYWVKGSVVRILGELNARGAADEIFKILKDEDSHPWLVESSVEALVQMQITEAIPLLKKILERENIDIYARKTVLNFISATEITLPSGTTTVRQDIKNLIDQVVGKILPVQFGLSDIYVFGAPGRDEPIFSFADGQFTGLLRKTPDNDLEVEIFTPILDFEGGLITIKAGNHEFTEILFKRGNKVGTKFLIPGKKRKEVSPETNLIVSRIKITDSITKEDLKNLELLLNEMRASSSRNKKAAVEKIDKYFEFQ